LGNSSTEIRSDIDQLGPLKESLRARRKELGLTMQQVADQAGLSVGFISQIERGITAPSLSSLVSVSRVLGLHISQFLAQPSTDAPQTKHNERVPFAINESSVTYERISSSFPGSILRSVIINEPPGHRAEPISHEGEEMLFVLEGAITVELDGDRSILESGDSIHFSSRKVHSTWNHSEHPATILWAGTMDVFGDD
jgi:transcriptional regulator with XRE-family HTH domain